MGSSKKQLITQFLGEAFLLTLIAALLSLAIAPWLLKVFGDFIPEELHFNLTLGIVAFLLMIVIVVSLLSGFYPALILSSFKPVSTLKNQVTTGNQGNLWLRKTFTVSQFVIAQVFVIGTIIVSKQLSFTLNKDLGFKKDAIVYLRTNGTDADPSKRFVFMENLRAIPEVKLLSLASDPPSINSAWMNTFQYKDGAKEEETAVQVKRADTSYLPLFEIELVAGRNLSISDTTKEFVINETYVRTLGFTNPADAIGQSLYWDNKPYPVVGVVKDFHQRSLHEAINPLVLATGTNEMSEINIALQSKDGKSLASAIGKIEKAWGSLYDISVRVSFSR